MAAKIMLRVAVPPLTSSHVVCAFANQPGSGFAAPDATLLEPGYVATLHLGAAEEIERNATFQTSIRGMVYQPTKKPIARLTPRNQFMALSAALRICDAPADMAGHPLQYLRHRPFVLTLADAAALNAARLTDADPETSESRLHGFIESYMGSVAGLFVE